MKKRIFTTLILACSMLACLALSLGIAGKWTGTIKTPDGNQFPLTYNFKTDSGKLTGTASSAMGEFTIANGKMLSESEFTFTLSINGSDVKNAGKYYPQADSIGMDIYNNGLKLHTTLMRTTGK